MSGVKQNPREIGWMYSAPAMNKKGEKVRYPPLSQIPGWGTSAKDDSEEKDPYIHWYKPTDTPYIILSKEGGRKDLLYFKENVFDKDAPARPYPRIDWLNWKTERPDKDHTEIYVPKLPEYMIHNVKPHPIPMLTGARRKQRPTLGSDFPMGISLGKYKTMNNIDVPIPLKSVAAVRQGLEAIEKEKPDTAKLLAHGYAHEYEIIRKEYHKTEVEQIAKMKKEEAKYDPFKCRRGGTKGYGGKAKKPKNIIGGW